MADNIQHDDQITVTLPADVVSQVDSLLGGEFTNREDFMLAAARHYVSYVQSQEDSTAPTTPPDDNPPMASTEDSDPPFSPPTSPVSDTGADLDTRTQQGTIDPTHQALDTNIDSHEVYDEGLAGAAEAEEPNAGNAVVDYDPANDPRKQDESS